MSKNMLITFAGLITLLLVLGFLFSNTTLATEQDNQFSMQSLFQRLNRDGVTATIRFIASPVTNEPVWIVPSQTPIENENISILRAISEISEDHICFSVTAGGSRTVTCVPFTNIASVTYDEYS